MLLFLRQLILTTLLLTTLHPLVMAKQLTVGWLEEVAIGDSGFQIEAKIDTGADNSSINATRTQTYTKAGKQWIKFTIQNENGRVLKIDRPILKTTEVKTKSGGLQQRAVIELELCVGTIQKLAEVNLVDRSHFKYQLLIGRSFLSPEFLVDPAKEFSIGPKCK